MVCCCDGWDNTETATEVKECPSCGVDVDEDGIALVGCKWSPVLCEMCQDAPCDGSC